MVGPDEVEQHIKELHALDLPRTELLRSRVDEIVKDKNTAEKLKAWYGSWCKRPSFHDEYLQTFNKPNVTLVDTDGKGIDRYTKNGIVYNGTEYEIDALVLATGFTFAGSEDVAEKLRMSIQGRNGLTMKDYWHSPDAGTMFGLVMPGFPNFFSVLFRGGPLSWNHSSTMDTLAKLTVSIVLQAQKQVGPGQRVIIEASEEGERKYGIEVAKRALWYSAMPTCTPGYFNGEAAAAFEEKKPKTDEELIQSGKKMGWGSGPLDYREMIKDYLSNKNLEGFKIELVGGQP
jgi:cation diffusion facilitator CzcD-associated flavoprotein CzcO